MPCCFGLLLGCLSTVLSSLPLKKNFEQHIEIGMALCCALTMLSALTYAVTGLCGKECRFWTRSQGLRAMHTFLILCDSAMAIPWMRLPHKNLSNWDIFLHFFIPIAILTFNICLIAQLNQYSLETKELTLRAGHLDFQTLDDATCTSPADEVRIREAIAGHEDDIFFKTLLVAILWFMSMLDTGGAAEVQSQCPDHYWAKWLWIAAGITAISTVALPFLIWRLQETGPQLALNAVKAWLFLAMLVVGIPLTMQIENHMLSGMHFLHIHRPTTGDRCPSHWVLILLAIFRPFLAGAATCYACSALCCHTAGDRKCPMTRTLTTSGEESTEESRVDPDDQGDLPDRLMPLSRLMGKLLRYKPDYFRRMGVVMDADGWVPLTELLSLDDFVDFAAADVREVVKESYSKDQPRFECREQGGRLEIRALHKRAAVRFSKGNRMEWRKRASSPEPPLVESPFEERLKFRSKRNKMRGAVASATEHFDISEECTKDDPGDLPDGLSSSHVEWVRFELSEGVFAWWCTRDDGSEDGFVEMNPDGAPGDGRRASDELCKSWSDHAGSTEKMESLRRKRWKTLRGIPEEN
eukprot:g21117.t1